MIGGGVGELEIVGLASAGLSLGEVNGEYEGVGVGVATRAAFRAVKCDVANRTPAAPAASTTTAKTANAAIVAIRRRDGISRWAIACHYVREALAVTAEADAGRRP